MQISMFPPQGSGPAASACPPLKPELDQWFTPFWAAEMLAEDVLRSLGRVGVVEPSCGSGSFLSAIPSDMPAYGVEIDPDMAAVAATNTGRRIVVGDFRTVELPEWEIGAIIGNPPFGAEDIDGFLSRSHAILPDEGVAAFILPAHAFSTTTRVRRWNERYAIEVKTIPRSLFGRISMPLVWAKFVKTRQRTLVGLLLFAEQTDVESMPREVRRRLGGPGTWHEAVTLALQSLQGEATLQQIYRAVEPRRPSGNQWWKEKVRQTLRAYFTRVDEHRWRLAA